MRTALPVWTLAVLALAATSPGRAFDFIVTEYTDDVLTLVPGCTADHCTLREAVIAANAGVDADRILLSAGTYLVTIGGTNENLAADGDLDLSRSVEIVGAGAGITILDGNGLTESIVTANFTGSEFTLRNLTLRNRADIAVLLGDGTHTLEDCEIRDNAIGIFSTIDSVATLRRVLVAGNTTQGLTAVQSSTTIENSTFSGNGHQELGINLPVAFFCTHCTIADPADVDPEITVDDGTATFTNSIVHGNCLLFPGGAISSGGGNVESTGNTCNFVQGTDLNSRTSVQLDLAALADNGGPTRTNLPGAASVAVGNADDALCLDEDQRGVARSTDCDSGAVERTNEILSTPIFNDGFQQGNPGAWIVSP